jgi:hypothetical protein
MTNQELQNFDWQKKLKESNELYHYNFDVSNPPKYAFEAYRLDFIYPYNVYVQMRWILHVEDYLQYVKPLEDKLHEIPDNKKNAFEIKKLKREIELLTGKFFIIESNKIYQLILSNNHINDLKEYGKHIINWTKIYNKAD